MTKDEVLKVHSGVFYVALTSQNDAALEELYSHDTYWCARMVPF